MGVRSLLRRSGLSRSGLSRSSLSRSSLSRPGLRALLRSVSGIAAVEFAFVAPVLLSLYLVGNTLSDAIACNRKVTSTARAVADMTTRFAAVTTADVQTVLDASSQIMLPYNVNNGAVVVSEIKVTSASQAIVVWSRTRNGTALTTGATITIPSNMAAVDTYLIVGTVSYPYVPVISWGNVGTINMADTIYMSPRLSEQVPLT